jgi:hypothetical protein
MNNFEKWKSELTFESMVAILERLVEEDCVWCPRMASDSDEDLDCSAPNACENAIREWGMQEAQDEAEEGEVDDE